MNALQQSDLQALAPKFDDRPVMLIGLPVPGVKNSSTDHTITLAIYRYGVAPLVDEKKRLVRAFYNVDELSVWENASDRIIALPASATVAEARELFVKTGHAIIPITKNGRYSGYCASVGQLGDLDAGNLRPLRIGGLATPLGVYMTTGVHTGGAGLMGMLAMGIVFGTAAVLINWLFPVFFSALIAVFPKLYALSLWPPLQTFSTRMAADILQLGFVVVMTLGVLQFTPLSALHAAEHMTIHALENDLPVDEPTVRRQPRAHPRCGTNLAVILIGLQLGALFFMELQGRVAWYGLALYAGLWAAVLYMYWHKMGMWVQWHFTTRTPSPAELESGLKAGRDVSERFAADPHPLPPFWRRLWTMGFLQLIGGFMLAATLTQLLISFGLNGWQLPPYWWHELLK